MKHHLITLLFIALLVTGSAAAQQIDLQGRISIHNSRYRTGQIEYVAEAFVSAPFAGSTNSDAEGKFGLTFNGIAEGTSIELTVEKAGYEVVNQKDLLDVVIGRRLPVKIYLATRGQLANAQTELYNVSLQAITKRYDETIAQLRRAGAESEATIRDLEEKLNREIEDRFEAEQVLMEQLEATKRRLPEFARELATVNLDFASKMYQEAYAYFEAGEIEKAIETLDEAILDKAAQESVENLDSIGRYIDQLEGAIELEGERFAKLIELSRIEARAYADQRKYEQALGSQVKIIQLLIERQQFDTTLVEAMWQTGGWYHASGKTKFGLGYQQKSLDLYESLPQKQDSLLRRRYMILADAYESAGRIDDAIQYYQKAYDVPQTPREGDRQPLQEKIIQLLDQSAWELAQAQDYAGAVLRYEAIQAFPLSKKRARQIRKRIKKWEKRK